MQFTPTVVSAHPLIVNALDVVIRPDRIVVDARISNEEVLLIASDGSRAPTEERLQQETKAHGEYVLRHVHVLIDGQELSGRAVYVPHPVSTDRNQEDAGAGMSAYQLDYAIAAPPKVVQFQQDFLREYPEWNAPCELRIRRSDQIKFDLRLFQWGDTVEFKCEWTPDMLPVAPESVRTNVNVVQTFFEYLRHGIHHILTGYDHLLFVSALVLAATRVWDLFKVVTAFTIAHTLTLVLSVFNVVTLSERIVEPMIAASIVFVAVQNIFWPERSRGWTRLAIAFGFGLFHGLGFAGGLKEAMVGLPSHALWIALIAFSLGVEIGHQIVVLPLFGTLQIIRNFNTDEPRTVLMDRIRQVLSAAIACGGVYFFGFAMKWW